MPILDREKRDDVSAKSFYAILCLRVETADVAVYRQIIQKRGS